MGAMAKRIALTFGYIYLAVLFTLKKRLNTMPPRIESSRTLKNRTFKTQTFSIQTHVPCIGRSA